MDLTEEQRNILVNWILDNLIPTPKTNYKIDTSDIRKSFEFLYIYGFYVDNLTMNKTLCECGFIPAELSDDPYLCWNISSKSRAIQIYRSSLGDDPKNWRYE